MAALGLAITSASCGAADYSFTLSELLGSPQGEQNLSIDLGGEFTSITAARLSIAGTHTPGLLGDLHSPPQETFPYPASIDAYSPATPFNQSGILGEVLPAVAGPFEVDEAFRRIQPGGPPDFSSWLDGTADFYFSAGGAAYVAIYRELEQPTVNITSATLVVTGDRLPAGEEPSADFDGNGAVDGQDLAHWRTSFGQAFTRPILIADANEDGDADGADFLAWQRQLGSGQLVAATTAIPEPTTAALFAVGLALAATCRFRKRAMATEVRRRGHVLPRP
jgi:hypothetical protein